MLVIMIQSNHHPPYLAVVHISAMIDFYVYSDSCRQVLLPSDDVTCTCGAHLQDMEMIGSLAEVYARVIRCCDPIENLYYSVGT